MMVSVDGFFEGPNHEIDWHNVDSEFNEFAIAQLQNIDTILFGRKTYELMAHYWPTDVAKDDPIVAGLMSTTAKIVFSKTITSPSWNNTKLIRTNVGNEITRLKKQKGRDIAIFGSNNFAVSLIRLHVLDEVHLMINPVALGKGNQLFQGLGRKVGLTLHATRTFTSGNVLVTYGVKKQ